ncbi:MAG: FAD:protein FMN transferase, partial [Actinomycetales bacterium]
WSRFRPDSVVTALAATPGAVELPAEASPLLDLYRRLDHLTSGAVTPLMGRALADLGYDATYSLRPSGRAAVVPGWSVLTWEPPVLTTHEPVLLDVGAAGKGLLADLVADVLRSSGVETFSVDASGDLVHRGRDPLRVALEHPLDPTVAVGVAELAPGTALCASAVNRRAWGEGLHHVLDGRTGRPTHDVLATWVVADTCLLADGAATAAFFVPPPRLEAELGVASARLLSTGRLEWSATFPGEMFV